MGRRAHVLLHHRSAPQHPRLRARHRSLGVIHVLDQHRHHRSDTQDTVAGAVDERVPAASGCYVRPMNDSLEQGTGTAEYTHRMPRKRAAATVVFTDGRGRVLLCEPTYKRVWEAPGGAVETDESPHRAAAREVREELGLEVAPGRLLAVDWVPPIDGRSEGVVYVFDGGRLSPQTAASIRLAADELRSWEWCTVGQAHERMRPLVARRIEVALAAAEAGTTAYLEAGCPVEVPTGQPASSPHR